MKKVIISIALVATISGCTGRADRVGRAYVSPATYSGRSCQSLQAEYKIIAEDVRWISSRQDTAAGWDAAIVGFSILITPLAAALLATTDDKSPELAAAKGNYEAITKQMEGIGCRIPAPPQAYFDKI